MRMSFGHIAGLKAVLLGTVLFTPSAIAQNQASLEEVTVTAKRREASLQDVPVAVSAFDGATLERRQIARIRDIFTDVPGLVGSNNVGQNTATTFFLRGIGTTESIVTVDPAVAVYVDDVYIARQGVNNFGLYDLERVEVLRGPQGTLYGRNSSAGAIKVVSKTPTYDFEGRGSLTFGSYNTFNARLSVNVPIVDDVIAVRMNALTETHDGYTQNVVLDDEVNNRDFKGFRAQFRIDPAQDLQFIVTADYMEDDSDSIYPSDRAGILRPVGDLFNSFSGTDQFNLSRTWGLSAKGTWDATPNMTIESITGYRATLQEYLLDVSDQNPAFFNLYTDNDSRQISQEVNVTGDLPDWNLSYVAGVFFFDENSTSFLGNEFNIPTPGGIIEQFGAQTINTGSQSIALFGELNYAITERLDFFAGARWTDEDKTLDTEFFVNLPPGFGTDGGTRAFSMNDVVGLGTPDSLNFTEITPRAGFNFAITPDILTYFQFSRGFKSGGWVARLTGPDPEQVLDFDPEIVDLFEIGSKVEGFGGTLRVNTALFFQDFQNLFNTFATEGGGFSGATSDASIYGFEFEGTWRVTEWLDFFGNFSIMEGKYKNLTENLNNLLGEDLQRLPRFQGKAGFSVAKNLPSNLGLFRLNADYSYMGDHFTDITNVPVSETQFELVNASIGWERPDGAFGISLGCTNCFDEQYFHSLLDFGLVQPAYAGLPAFYTVTLEAAF